MSETALKALKARPLLVASHNEGKVEEFRRWFEPLGVTTVSATDLSLPEPEETATDFIGNARLKADAAAPLHTGPVLADDSGLAIEALNGAPGLYSARWAKEAGGYPQLFAQLRKKLDLAAEAEGARAAFVCVLFLYLGDGRHVAAEGRVNGRLTFPPRGEGGFGYDPIFVPDGDERTFGEMSAAEKARYSHRARAIEALIEKISVS